MLILFTIALMLICAFVYLREGLFTAVCMCVNVLLSGLIAFNFFEPLADGIESLFERTWLQGYEDFGCMVGIFCVCLAILRNLTNRMNNEEVEYQPTLNALGAAAVALVTGYLLAGFLVCAMQTLPWHQNFLGFEPYQEKESPVRRLLPPDRVWLALMHRAGTYGLSRADTLPTFDVDGTFESYYFHFRRYGDTPAGEPQKQ
jgi:hypothetical protein